MFESEDTRTHENDAPPAEPAPPPEESGTPPHGDPLADEATDDDASSQGGVRD
jgi:hypothetical protein